MSYNNKNGYRKKYGSQHPEWVIKILGYCVIAAIIRGVYLYFFG
jgi:hypothetical protein